MKKFLFVYHFLLKVIAEYEVKPNALDEYDDRDKLWRHYFDVEEHWGKKVQLRLFDHNKEGYLMFDDFRSVTKCSRENFLFFFFFHISSWLRPPPWPVGRVTERSRSN